MKGNVIGARRQVQKALFIEPSRRDARRDLAKLALQDGSAAVARATLVAAGEGFDDLRQTASLQAVAECLGASEASQVYAHSLAQKAVMLAPWDMRNWGALAYVQNETA